jgi:hypothetical protein
MNTEMMIFYSGHPWHRMVKTIEEAIDTEERIFNTIIK